MAVDVDDVMASEPDTLRALNRRILDVTARMVVGERAVVHVLHVWDAPDEGLVRSWSHAPDPDKAAMQYVSDVKARHWHALDRMIEQAHTWIGPDLAKKIDFQPQLVRGTARQAIAERTRELEVDVLVMGTIARTGVPGFVIGNTVEDILNSIECSVVTVKPPHYVSPLELVDSN